jgi:hypothetical protein
MSVVNLLGSQERYLQERGLAIVANISAIDASHDVIFPAISQVFFYGNALLIIGCCVTKFTIARCTD